MKYRELLEKQQTLREKIGCDKYNLALSILKKSNGKLSSSEALAIVSKLSKKEAKILSERSKRDETIQIINHPRDMAKYLVVEKSVYEEYELHPKSQKEGQHKDLKVLYGECIVRKVENVYRFVPTGTQKRGYYSFYFSAYIRACKECNFEVDDKLAVLVTTIPDNSKLISSRSYNIYIYIPHGEYI